MPYLRSARLKAPFLVVFLVVLAAIPAFAASMGKINDAPLEGCPPDVSATPEATPNTHTIDVWNGGTIVQSISVVITEPVLGNLPDPTRAYWAPGEITSDVVLNPGTYWIVGESEDAEGNPFYKIVLADQYLFVPADAMDVRLAPPYTRLPQPTHAAP